VEPYSYKSNGRQYGNAAAAAAICDIAWETYQWYVRTGRPASNPAPKHVKVDDKTGQRMYDLKQVRAWHASRKGRGNWGGIGALARKPQDEGVSTPEESTAPGATVEPTTSDA